MNSEIKIARMNIVYYQLQ